MVVEIRISDELRKDLRAEIRDAINSSPLIKRLTNGSINSVREVEDARRSHKSISRRLSKMFMGSIKNPR